MVLVLVETKTGAPCSIEGPVPVVVVVVVVVVALRFAYPVLKVLKQTFTTRRRTS